MSSQWLGILQVCQQHVCTRMYVFNNSNHQKSNKQYGICNTQQINNNFNNNNTLWLMIHICMYVHIHMITSDLERSLMVSMVVADNDADDEHKLMMSTSNLLTDPSGYVGMFHVVECSAAT